MNYTTTDCDLIKRVYTPSYVFFKELHATYLRYLLVPGILLNTLCLIILSQPKLSNKSTTIVFLRFLALFDILAIVLKYIRSEITYQSRHNKRDLAIVTKEFCKMFYVLMNSSISIAMWIIVLMSLEKVLAVCNPLKSSIWLSKKRATYICCVTIIILVLANLPYIFTSGLRRDYNSYKYCGVLENHGVMLDAFTASILPMSLIAAANFVIVIILRHTSKNSRQSLTPSKLPTRRESESTVQDQDLLRSSKQIRPSGLSTNIISGVNRRTSSQVTRMLLAVTLTLIFCNFPNTIYSIWKRFSKRSKLLLKPRCNETTDHDIYLYYIEFYFGMLAQNILSDLPHILNFFLYCLSGQKFRSIFISELQSFLFHLHFLKQKTQQSGQTFIQPSKFQASQRINLIMNPGRSSPARSSVHGRQSVEVLYNGQTVQALIDAKKQQNFNRNKTFRQTIIGPPTRR